MKFTIVNEQEELYGREALLQHLKNTKKSSDVVGPKCPKCKGWGKIFKNDERLTCPKCKGTGVLKEEHVEFFKGECPTCLGSGYTTKRVEGSKKPWPSTEKTHVIKSTCSTCKGKGKIKENFTAAGSINAPALSPQNPLQAAGADGQPTIALATPEMKKKAKRKKQIKTIMARRTLTKN
jgi:hypothetical protein